MVKLIVKTIVINGKIHKNKRKRFYSSNKEFVDTKVSRQTYAKQKYHGKLLQICTDEIPGEY
jgi:hypothetical protein